jgi:hypothetical protein
VVEASKVHQILDSVDYFPSVDIDLAMPAGETVSRVGGWRLEYFMSDLLLGCFVGKRFISADDEELFEIFDRRSGPRALQAYLGHKNIQHTVRYTELSPTRFKNFWRA